jgi:hypothetical protein
MRVTLLIFLFSLLLSSCSSDTVKPNLHISVYPSPDPNGFYLQIYKQYTGEKPLLVRVSKDKTDTLVLDHDMAIKGYWGDSSLVHSHLSDTHSVCLYNLFTQKHKELLPGLIISESTPDCRYFTTYNPNNFAEDARLYRFDGFRCTSLMTVIRGSNITFHNDSLLIVHRRSFREKNDTLSLLTHDGKTTILAICDLGQRFSGEVFTTDTLELLGNMNEILSYSIRSQSYDTLFTGYHFDDVIRIPNSGLYLLSGLTPNEFNTELMAIDSSVRQFIKENPGVICARPRPPKGYWIKRREKCFVH